ncbi:MAG TPA: DUF1475 family protein [Cyclobacteriaceae bacterium]
MKTKNLIPMLLAVALLILLLGCIVWASMESDVFVGLEKLMANRWGLTTLLDIYIALTFIGVWIGVMENSVTKGFIWTISLYLLGNLATLVYFIYRATKSDSFTEIFLSKSQR